MDTTNTANGANMKTEAAQIIIDTVAALADRMPEGIEIQPNQKGIFVQSTDGTRATKLVAEAKAIVAAYVQETYPSRTWLHHKSSGSKFWCYGYRGGKGVRAGVRLELTEAEETAIMIGGADASVKGDR